MSKIYKLWLHLEEIDEEEDHYEDLDLCEVFRSADHKETEGIMELIIANVQPKMAEFGAQRDMFTQLTDTQWEVIKHIMEYGPAAPRRLEEIGGAGYRQAVEYLMDNGVLQINNDLKLEPVLTDKKIQEALDAGRKELYPHCGIKIKE